MSDAAFWRFVGTWRSRKNCGSHIDASHSRQPLVKGERLVRYEVNAVMPIWRNAASSCCARRPPRCFSPRRASEANARSASRRRAIIFEERLAPCGGVGPANIQRTAIRYPEGCAAPSCVPCQRYARGPLSKLERTPPQAKINVTSKSPVGDISVVTLIRTDTTLDHSQKAEKVCFNARRLSRRHPCRRRRVVLQVVNATQAWARP